MSFQTDSDQHPYEGYPTIQVNDHYNTIDWGRTVHLAQELEPGESDEPGTVEDDETVPDAPERDGVLPHAFSSAREAPKSE